MPSVRSRFLWDNGVALTEAWRVYAGDADRALLDRYPGLVGLLDAKSEAISNSNSIPEFFSSLSGIGAEWRERRQLEIRLKEELLDTLFNGDLVVTGYRELPSTSAAPVTILPDDIEFAEVDWPNSRLSFDGKRFGNIRVTDEFALIDAGLPKRQIGRQGSGAAIKAAIEVLASDPKFQGMPRKEACQLIREQLGRPKEYENGLSDINLSKYIVRKFGPKAISD